MQVKILELADKPIRQGGVNGFDGEDLQGYKACGSRLPKNGTKINANNNSFAVAA